MRARLKKRQTIGFYNAIIPIIVSVFGVYLTIGIALALLLSIMSWLATVKLPAVAID
ncbi:hypothetical protein HS960_06550 [Sphingobacterium paramultivorum]|uniref:Uncharacterized protein n=1 Tax=Sphingobacterium paramultivorum TaxID=2886510 RepID=A0A7G5E013_9SPHI|nr:hypothetical protein [Sphingobacterium paramultivorum]QMV67338.1 hypothetical protein HS960_06550 [Sphingobacterium paramultivorum]WSO16195.1 hypothetical protein VUL84_06530 [Sphingobacterium paramultivorum]